MTSDPESTLFDFAASNRPATNEEEKTVTELHAALGTTGVPLRLRRPPVITPKPRWRNSISAAITAVLVIAVATAGFFAIQQQTSTPSPTEVPEVVLGLAGQESTATTDNTCAIDASIPVIKGVSTSPIDGAALLLTPEGDVILDCAGDQDVLASGIEEVTPQSWPGVISMWDGETVTYLNIATGDSYVSEDLTHINSQRNIGPITARSTNQLIIVPATGSPTDAAILDLATLVEEQLFDSDGNPIPIVNIPAATSNNQGDCMVLAYSIHNTRMNSDYLGGFVVFDADGQTQTVDSLELQMPVPREIATSPDCDQIASVSFQGQQMEGTTTITIQDVNGGDTVSIPLSTPDMLTNLLWLKDGSGIVFGAGENLKLWEAPLDSSEPITLHEGLVLDDISLTRESNIVTVNGMSYGGGPDSVPQRTLIVNISNQEVTEIEGYYLLRQRRLQPQEHNILLVQEDQGQVYDATTGELLGEMDGDIEFSSSFIQVPIYPLSSAEVGIVGTSPDDLWRVLDSDGNPTMERIKLPTGSQLQGQPMISLSQDGWMFISQGWDSQTGWMTDLDDPNADWIEITFESDVNTVQFLNTEGLAVSADATPQASPIANAGCDMSGEIPLLVGINESPLDRTTVIVTLDKELKVVCQDQETVLAEEVQIATPTQTPYVLLLMTQTGPMLLNVKTAESLHIQQPPVMAEQTIGMQTWDGWALLPSTENSEGVSLYLLDTFVEIPVIVGDNAIGMESIGGIAVGANDDVVALAITEDGNENSKTVSRLFIANLDGSSHTVEIPEFDSEIQMVISPDGSTVAIVSFEGEQHGGAKRISLLDTANGSLINKKQIGTDPRFIDINWLNDGSALLYTNDTGLHMLAELDGEPTTILEGDNVQGLALTHDNSVVAIGHREALDSGGFQPVTTIINLETGEQQELVGRDLWSGSSMATRRSTLVLSDQYLVPNSDPTVYTVYDAVTGEALGEIEHTKQEQGFSHTSWGYNRDITAVAFGVNSVWKLTNEDAEPALISVDTPPVETDGTNAPVQITVSPQGMMTLRTYEPNSAWILLPGEDAWNEVKLPDPAESQGVNANIGIIPGSDE